MNVLKMWYEKIDFFFRKVFFLSVFQLINSFLKPIELINYRRRYLRVEKKISIAFLLFFLLRK